MEVGRGRREATRKKNLEKIPKKFPEKISKKIPKKIPGKFREKIENNISEEAFQIIYSRSYLAGISNSRLEQPQAITAVAATTAAAAAVPSTPLKELHSGVVRATRIAEEEHSSADALLERSAVPLS